VWTGGEGNAGERGDCDEHHVAEGNGERGQGERGHRDDDRCDERQCAEDRRGNDEDSDDQGDEDGDERDRSYEGYGSEGQEKRSTRSGDGHKVTVRSSRGATPGTKVPFSRWPAVTLVEDPDPDPDPEDPLRGRSGIARGRGPSGRGR
jgi:hypothetical protein